MVVLSGGLAAMVVVVLLCSWWYSWEVVGGQGEVGMDVGVHCGVSMAVVVVGWVVVRVWDEVGEDVQEFLGGALGTL